MYLHVFFTMMRWWLALDVFVARYRYIIYILRVLIALNISIIYIGLVLYSYVNAKQRLQQKNENLTDIVLLD